jgi:hypothetical protein
MTEEELERLAGPNPHAQAFFRSPVDSEPHPLDEVKRRIAEVQSHRAPFTPEEARAVAEGDEREAAEVDASNTEANTFAEGYAGFLRQRAATLRAYASLLTREAKMREALEEIAGRGGDCGRIARRALEETKG